MPDRYRVSVQFDAARSVYVARAPELHECSAEGDTRAQALAELEEEIAAQVATIRDQGRQAPLAVDELPDPLTAGADGAGERAAGAESGGDAAAGQRNGELLLGRISARISASLHRELLYAARFEGVEVDTVVGELLAEALALRGARSLSPAWRRRGRPEARMGGNAADSRRAERHDEDAQPTEWSEPTWQGERRGGRGRGGGGGGRFSYAAIMDDKASFLEYVRGLTRDEGGPGRGAGGGGGGGPRRGRNRRRGGRRGPPGTGGGSEGGSSGPAED
jgi:predicted RNase H-like HicB family nuclease